MVVPKLTSSDVGATSRAKINNAFDAIDANATAILSEAQARGQAETLLSNRVDAATAQIQAEEQSRLDADAGLSQSKADRNELAAVFARRYDLLGSDARPGDTPAAFTIVSSRAALSGNGRNFAEIPSSALVTSDSGRTVRITGPGILAQRNPTPVESSRLYRLRYVVQRRANPSDPSNDSVVLGVLWLDAGLNVLPPSDDVTIVEDMQDLIAGFGSQERHSIFSRAPSVDRQFAAPSRARYARAYVQSYGLDGVTDIDVLGIDDITRGVLLAPETADTVQQVAALTSVNAGQRLAALEASANAPNSVTFATKSDAASGTIASTVTTVALRGLAQAGDGGDGIYVKIAGSAPSGADAFINSGTTFVRVFTSAQVLGALLLSLPTDLPAASGVAWLNGGVLAVS